jgi:hypothetical protein
VSYLDDIGQCPEAELCEGCGADEALDVVTVSSPVGVFCVTLCGDCRRRDRTPSLSAPAAVRAVLEHCGHLGISADAMEKILEHEER